MKRKRFRNNNELLRELKYSGFSKTALLPHVAPAFLGLTNDDNAVYDASRICEKVMKIRNIDYAEAMIWIREVYEPHFKKEMEKYKDFASPILMYPLIVEDINAEETTSQAE